MQNICKIDDADKNKLSAFSSQKFPERFNQKTFMQLMELLGLQTKTADYKPKSDTNNCSVNFKYSSLL